MVLLRQLEGRVALVTGSSRGIGAAIARLFAAEGATVAVHGRDPSAVETVRSEIASAGGTAIGVTGDLTVFADLERMRGDIEASAGPVDVLVANAGAVLHAPGPLEEIPVEAWRATVEANLGATFLTLKAFLPGMKNRGRGDIVTISSTAARRPGARAPIAYAAAKAGVQLLTQDVALQAGPFGVRANCIAPETILTEDNRRRIPIDLQSKMAEMHATRRLGTPEDVARAALFLIDRNQSGWITGAVLDLHGGTLVV
ncbi:MAG TPA: SDR family NAD(P)-dependent oxidoreductase [Candidatus Dormibacteraeota bacterium]|nr:SDR family NAD(P)-dependent oxidoreductase [Candidatus Dormibacteraeota bacterium]